MVVEYGVMLNDVDKNHPVLVHEKDYDYNGEDMCSPQAIAKMMNSCLQLNRKAEEYVYMISFTAAGDVLGLFQISHGNIRESLLGNREIFIRALLSGAATIAVIHNHPSGQVIPSRQDRDVCHDLKKTADMMGIRLIDFIIVGGQNYYSFEEAEMLQ